MTKVFNDFGIPVRNTSIDGKHTTLVHEGNAITIPDPMSGVEVTLSFNDMDGVAHLSKELMTLVSNAQAEEKLLRDHPPLRAAYEEYQVLLKLYGG